jgi:hypothetical protein
VSYLEVQGPFLDILVPVLRAGSFSPLAPHNPVLWTAKMLGLNLGTCFARIFCKFFMRDYINLCGVAVRASSPAAYEDVIFLPTTVWDHHPPSAPYPEAQCPSFDLVVPALQANSALLLAPPGSSLLTTKLVGPNLGTWFSLICSKPFVSKSTILGAVAVRASSSAATHILNVAPVIRLADVFPMWDDEANGWFFDAECTPVHTVLSGLQTAGESLSYLSTTSIFEMRPCSCLHPWVPA